MQPKQFIILAILLFCLSSCRTNSIFDVFFYENSTKTAYNPVLSISICEALEEEGFSLKSVRTWDYVTRVIYDDSEYKDYIRDTSLEIEIYHEIPRDFDSGINPITESTKQNMYQEALVDCPLIISRLSSIDHLSYVGFTYRDWVTGNSLGYSFDSSQECSSLALTLESTGSSYDGPSNTSVCTP